MIKVVRRFMIHKYEPTGGWGFGGWLKDVFGKKPEPEDKEESELAGEESQESGSSSSSSSDGEGGIKIPIPDEPSRVFFKHWN